MLWRDIIRPFYGLLMVQPPILLFFILTTDDWWYDYLHVGWPLNLMVTKRSTELKSLNRNNFSRLKTDSDSEPLALETNDFQPSLRKSIGIKLSW